MTTEERRISIIQRLANTYPAVPGAGIGATCAVEALDDCAVVPMTQETDLVIGSDFVRGENFLLFKQGLLTRQQIGSYLIGANASDLAAMGATPLGVAVVYRYSNTTTDEHYAEVMEGVLRACQQHGIPLLGGDTGSYEAPVLSAAAFGICPKGRALLRSGARAGDHLFLTGTVGTAGAAFQYFLTKSRSGNVGAISPDIEAELLRPWRQVEPALAQAQALVQHDLSRCAIDTSDGLLSACRRLATASQVDIVLEADALPIPECVSKIACLLGRDRLELGCDVSVDFRLLFSAPSEVVTILVGIFANNRWPLYRVGEITPARGVPAVYLNRDGAIVPVDWNVTE